MVEKTMVLFILSLVLWLAFLVPVQDVYTSTAVPALGETNASINTSISIVLPTVSKARQVSFLDAVVQYSIHEPVLGISSSLVTSAQAPPYVPGSRLSFNYLPEEGKARIEVLTAVGPRTDIAPYTNYLDFEAIPIVSNGSFRGRRTATSVTKLGGFVLICLDSEFTERALATPNQSMHYATFGEIVGHLFGDSCLAQVPKAIPSWNSRNNLISKTSYTHQIYSYLAQLRVISLKNKRSILTFLSLILLAKYVAYLCQVVVKQKLSYLCHSFHLSFRFSSELSTCGNKEENLHASYSKMEILLAKPASMNNSHWWKDLRVASSVTSIPGIPYHVQVAPFPGISWRYCKIYIPEQDPKAMQKSPALIKPQSLIKYRVLSHFEYRTYKRKFQRRGVDLFPKKLECDYHPLNPTWHRINKTKATWTKYYQMFVKPFHNLLSLTRRDWYDMIVNSVDFDGLFMFIGTFLCMALRMILTPGPKPDKVYLY